MAIGNFYPLLKGVHEAYVAKATQARPKGQWIDYYTYSLPYLELQRQCLIFIVFCTTITTKSTCIIIQVYPTPKVWGLRGVVKRSRGL